MLNSKKILFIIMVILSAGGITFAQGFDWQYSARMPSSSPVFFIGVNGEFDYIAHSVDFKIKGTDNGQSPSLNNGLGRGYSIGLHCEYWRLADIAFFADINYLTQPGTFVTADEIMPRDTVQNFVSQYMFDSKISYLRLEIGGKYRLFGSNLHIGGGIQIKYLIDTSSVFTEQISEPVSIDVPVENAVMPEMYSLMITPEIRAGYDFSIGLGKYISAYISAAIPLMNIIKTEQWSAWVFSAGFSLNWGLM